MPYKVSDRGGVKNLKTGQVRRIEPCGKDRYPMVAGTGMHILVAETFLGPCPDGYVIHHKDHQKDNPALSNLEYITQSDNVQAALTFYRKNPDRRKTQPMVPAEPGSFATLINEARAALSMGDELLAGELKKRGVQASTQSVFLWRTKGRKPHYNSREMITNTLNAIITDAKAKE